MMLKALSGSILTAAGAAPGGASHVSSASARELLSSATSFEAAGPAEANKSKGLASRKRILASQSATNAATVVAVDDGSQQLSSGKACSRAKPSRFAPRLRWHMGQFFLARSESVWASHRLRPKWSGQFLRSLVQRAAPWW